MALTVTIGRNVGTTPMGEEDWQDFQAEALALVEQHSSEILFSGLGQGVYEGVFEESFAIVARDAGFNAVQVLKQNLSKLAGRYMQECIALAVGDTQLAYA